MGSFSVKCGVTQTEISEYVRNECVMIILDEEQYVMENDININASDRYKITPFIIKGKYNGYGYLDIDSIEYTNNFKLFLINAMDNIGRGSEMKCDKKAKKIRVDNIKEILGKDYQTDILNSKSLSDVEYLTEELISEIIREYYKVFIHRDVYETMMKEDIEFGLVGKELSDFKEYLELQYKVMKTLEQNGNETFKITNGNFLTTSASAITVVETYLTDNYGKDMYNIGENLSEVIEKHLDDAVNYFSEGYKSEDFRRDYQLADAYLRDIKNNRIVIDFMEFDKLYPIIEEMYQINKAFNGFGVLIKPSQYYGEAQDNTVFNNLLKEMVVKEEKAEAEWSGS